MRTLIIIFSILTLTTFGQTADLSSARKNLSFETNLVLTKLDSIVGNSTTLEFRTIGEGSRISNMYLTYAELTKVATEVELLSILANQKEKSVVRGYAYMAYVYLCDKEKKKEKQFNYNFTLKVFSGCLVNPYTFSSFVGKVHTRSPFDPYPRKFVVDPEEKEAIKVENKIQKEQGCKLPRK